jgi:peptidoglycan/xylan/chitin deacetylase (PgdA/CDA1 family)
MERTSNVTRFRPQILVAVVAIAVLGLGLFIVRGAIGHHVALWLRPATPKLQEDAVITKASSSVEESAQSVDCSKGRCLALTFDDGPNPVATPMILDILERQQVPATFFVVGTRAATQGATLRRMYLDGNEIGNHSWSHANMSTLSTDQVMAQINQTQSAVVLAGVPAPRLFRPPYGAVSNTMRTVIPMTFAMWNIDPLDWQERDPNKVRDRILAEAKPGGVVDMHDIYLTTAQALESAIIELKKQYHLVTYSQLFNLQAGQRGEYFGR